MADVHPVRTLDTVKIAQDTPDQEQPWADLGLKPDEYQRILDLPGYGYARASPVERAQWTKLINKLPARQSLAGLFLIIDIRRGIKDEDQQLVDWATAAGWQVHALLAKADKLNQRERSSVLQDAQAQLPEGVTAQIFSAHKGLGVEPAQKRLIGMLTS